MTSAMIMVKAILVSERTRLEKNVDWYNETMLNYIRNGDMKTAKVYQEERDLLIAKKEEVESIIDEIISEGLTWE